MKTERDLLSEAADMIEESSAQLAAAVKAPGQFGANLLGVTVRTLHKVIRVQILLLREQIELSRRLRKVETDIAFNQVIGGFADE